MIEMKLVLNNKNRIVNILFYFQILKIVKWINNEYSNTLIFFKKNMKQLLLLIISPLYLISCQSTLEKKYNEESVFEDAKDIIESEKLKENELKLLGSYIVEAKLRGINLINLSYSQIQKKSKDNFISHNEPSIEQIKKREQLDNFLKDLSDNLVYYKSKDNKYIIIELLFVNKTSKKIISETGSLGVPDLLINDVNGINALFKNGINSGIKKKATIKILCNPFDMALVSMKNERLEESKFRWFPEKIIFEDGTKIE
jgi:hypothetical protein